jgi:SAM-dependent methyltransferase
MSLSTPIAFFIFNRPDLTSIVFEVIRQTKPKTLLVVADGPRFPEEAEKCQQARRTVIEKVDWNCQVLTNFSEKNLGCKHRVSSGLDWVFGEVEEAIILEDDCLPTQSFFYFCQALLDYYRDDERVMHISGNNFQFDQSRTEYSYYFSKYPHIWGWASWRRAWKYYDVSMKTWLKYKDLGIVSSICEDPYEQKYWIDIFDRVYSGAVDTWDCQWVYTCWCQNGLAVLPNSNLVSNIGFRPDATHVSSESPLAQLPTSDIWDIEFPPFLFRHQGADAYTFDYVFEGKKTKQSITFTQKWISKFNKIKKKINFISIQKLAFLANLINLVTSSLVFRIRAGIALPGSEFDFYGRKLSFRYLFKGDKIRFLNLICNPVSSVRYFEFPFVFDSVNWTTVKSCLDISSPRLFFLYLLHKYPQLNLEILNPDINDLNETAIYLNLLDYTLKTNLVSYDATQLPYSDSSFDVITSISVIEHIPDNGDSLAIKELWRVLKPGGKLVITVPCARAYYEEWRDKDVYGLGNKSENGQYFFQRFYDNLSIKNRLFSVIDNEPLVVKVFGEKVPGTFDSYIHRWMKLGFKETIKDPFYIVRDYQLFDSIDSLPGVGICGLLFEKPL